MAPNKSSSSANNNNKSSSSSNPPKKIKKANSIQGERLQSSDTITRSILSNFTISEVLNDYSFISKRFYQASRSEQFWSEYNVCVNNDQPEEEEETGGASFSANLYMKCFGNKWTNLTLSNEALLSFKRRKNQPLPTFSSLNSLTIEWEFNEEADETEKENSTILSNLIDLLSNNSTIKEFHLKIVGEIIPNFQSTALKELEGKINGFKFTTVKISIGGPFEEERKNVVSQFIAHTLNLCSETVESLSIRSVTGIDALNYLQKINYSNLKLFEIKLVERSESSKEMHPAIKEIIINNADHLEHLHLFNDERIDISDLTNCILELTSNQKLQNLKSLIIGGTELKKKKQTTSNSLVSNNGDAKLPHLEKLIVKDVKSGEWLNSLLKCVQKSTNLKIVKLASIVPEEEHGYLDSAVELLNLSEKLKMRKLSLKRTPVSDSAIRKIFSLQNLNLGSLAIGTEDLNYFYMDDCKINHETLELVVKKCPNLEKLWISDIKVQRLFPILADNLHHLLNLMYLCPEIRGKELVEDQLPKTCLESLVSFDLFIGCSNDELARILNYTPNLLVLSLTSRNLSGQVMEVISESKCVSKLSEIVLNDLFYQDQPPCICEAELAELKQQSFKFSNNLFKKLEVLDYSIGHHLISLKLFVAMLCYCPALEEVIINGKNPIEGIDAENLCYKEMEELIATVKKKAKKQDEIDEFTFIESISIPRIIEQLKARKLSDKATENLIEQSVALVSGEFAERVEYQALSLVHHLLLSVLQPAPVDQEDDEDGEWEDEDE